MNFIKRYAKSWCLTNVWRTFYAKIHSFEICIIYINRKYEQTFDLPFHKSNLNWNKQKSQVNKCFVFDAYVCYNFTNKNTNKSKQSWTKTNQNIHLISSTSFWWYDKMVGFVLVGVCELFCVFFFVIFFLFLPEME